MRANRYVSYLATEIEPGALAKLSSFEQAQERAFDRIAAFNDRGAARLGTAIGASFDSRSRTAIANTASALRTVTTDGARARESLSATAREANLMSTAFFRSAQALNVVQGPLGPLAGRLSSLGYIFRDLAGISLAGVLGGGGAFAIGSIASSYQRMTDRLRPFYETQVQTNGAIRDVIQIAKDARQALDPVAQLYSRLDVAGRANNIATSTARLTETVAKAARLSGGDAQTQEAGLTQFAQGYGSGTLGGDELRSIRENTFRLAKALADGLGVPIAKLKELGAAGKLTPQVIADALERAAAQIDAEFARLPLRIGQALTQAEANLSIFLGRLDETTGATAGFAKAIALAGNNIPVVAAAVAGLGVAFAARSLSGPVNSATTALERFIGAQKLLGDVRAGRVIATPLTPEGIARAKAGSRLETAGQDVGAAARAVAAERETVRAVEARLTAAREAAAIALGEQRTVQQSARESVVLAQARVSAAEQELVVANQVAAARRTSDSAAALAARDRARADAASARGGVVRARNQVDGLYEAASNPSSNVGSRADQRRAAATAVRQLAVANTALTDALAGAEAAERRLEAAESTLTATRAAARTATTQQTAATTALSVAQAELATATQAATAATSLGTTAANASAARGFAILALTEQRVAAEAALAAATTVSAGAVTRATAATVAYNAAAGAFYKASALGQRALGLLTSAGGALSAMLGGPVGIALTAATVGLTLLATRTDEAKSASERFASAQDQLAAKLGTSTEEFEKASRAAAGYRLELAKNGLAEAKKKQRDALGSLGGSLTDAANNIDLSTAQGRSDFALTRRLAAAAASGDNSSGILRLSTLQQLQTRNPRAFESQALGRLLGSDPADVGIKAVGVKQTSIEVGEAERDIREAQRRQRERAKPINLDGPNRRSLEELRADAGVLSTGGTAALRARNEFDATKTRLDAEIKKRREDGDFSFDQEYVRQLAAAESKLNAVGDAQRSAAAGAKAHRAAITEQNTSLREAEQNAAALQRITGRYQDEPSAERRADTDKAAVDSLFTRIRDGKAEVRDTIQLLNSETGKLEPFTRADGEALKANIDTYLRKPITDTIRDQGRELEIARLILAGRSNEADLLRQRYDLQQRSTKLTDADLQKLRQQQAEQQGINDAIAQRNRLIGISARVAGDVQDTITDILSTPLNYDSLGSDLTGVFDRVVANFRRSIAEKISVTLFGDAEQEARDAMTRGLNTSADNLSSSAGDLSGSAAAMKEAAASIAAAGENLSGGVGGALGGGRSEDLFADALGGTLSAVGDTLTNLDGTVSELPKEIVVVGKREQKEQRARPLSIEQRYNQVGKDFATKVFGPNSILTKAAGKLGTFLSGAQYAGVGTAATGVLGTKGSSLGAAIGGGLGKSLLGGSDGLLAKGLGAISSKLGSFAGPLGSIAGSVIGSVIGGALKKTKKASATITSVDGDASVSGNSASYRAAAGGAAGNVQSGIARIAEALGGSAGGFAVSIGTRKKNFVVDPTGRGRTKGAGVQSFTSEEEAANAAILDAIRDGAVKGIRAGAQRLIAAGRDLDKQLQKAVDFQNVFRELKQYTDPVGAALDDLNLQFDRLINVFNEAGASAEEFGQLQQLYDLKRADAIKNATNDTVSALQDFLTGLKSGPDSPLGRRTVYNNARTQVDSFRADIAAGKSVDSEKLIDALSNFQDASAALNGSRQEFYSDFNDIVALAEKAKTNIEAGRPTGGTLPASPFVDPAVQASLGNIDQNGAATVDALGDIAYLLRQQNGGTSADGSSLSYLPSGGGGYNGGGLYGQNVAYQ
jgi:tape measure domain-containing protein